MRIIINEIHEKKLIKMINEESLYLDKVLKIKGFLDKNLSRADF